MSYQLNQGERIDQLFREKRKIIQSKSYFAFSLDAVLLADFIDLPKNKAFRYLDFCSGNGIIPILLSARTREVLEGIEIQAPLVDMAKRSIQLNRLENQVKIYQGDIRDLRKPDKEYDFISCNPPYFLPSASKDLHKVTSHQIARHEITLSMEDWIQKAGILLKEKGRLYLVHRPDRLDDLMESLLKYHFSIKRMKFVHPKANENANIVLIEAIYRGGRRGVRIEPSIIVHQENNQYTPEMRAIYYG